MTGTAWRESARVIRRFAGELLPHRWRLALVGVLSMSTLGLDLLRPWPIQWIFDGALAAGPSRGPAAERIIWYGAGAAAAIFAGRAVLNYFKEVRQAEVRHQFLRELRTKTFGKLSSLSPRFYARQKSGDLLMRLMGDSPMVSTMMVESTVELSTRVLLVIATIAVMVALDPLLTVAVLATGPVLLIVVGWISRHITIAVRKQRRKEGELADYLQEAVSATALIQSLDGSDEIARRFARNNRRDVRAGLKAKKLAARLAASVETLLGVATGSALLLGSLRVTSGHLSPGELLVFLSYVRSLLKPLRSASKHADRIAKGTACGERILAVLDEQDRVRSRPGALPFPSDPASLGFTDVSYSYNQVEAALDGFTARFHRGELSALVGRNGAGKSTVASLAARLFDPDEGSVDVDGQALCELELSSLRQSVGLCMQSSLLFGETLRENLLLARPGATDEELQAALASAGALRFVTALPAGLDTELGSGGVGLSGGQMRSLALARTLLRRTPILVIDEPFAGLDAQARAHVLEGLHELAADRILIVVLHEADELARFDRVAWLESGRLRGQGPHGELLLEDASYRRLVGASSGGAG